MNQMNQTAKDLNSGLALTRSELPIRSFLEASQLYIGLLVVYEQQVKLLYGKYWLVDIGDLSN